MKITFVALNYEPSTGGAQELVRRLARGLADRGHTVNVLTTDALRAPSARHPGRIEARHETLDGVQVDRYRLPRAMGAAQRGARIIAGAVRRRTGRHAGRSSPWLSGPLHPGLVRAVARAARSADVVIGCSAPYASAVVPTWRFPRRRARVALLPLLHVSSVDQHPAVVRALRRSDLTVACTTFEADYAIAAGVDPDLVTVIAPGTDPTAFADLDPAGARLRLGLPDRPTVGFIGRLAAYKGIDTLLDAAPAIWAARPDTTVLIAGGRTGWDGYRDAAVAELGGDRLVIREGFTDDERALLFSACDLIAHPSREESFGLIAIEAWAARRPVVLASIPSVASFVEQGVTGVLVPPGDADALGRAVIELLDSPDRRTQLAQAGRAEVEARYDWDRVIDAWHDALVDLVDGGR